MKTRVVSLLVNSMLFLSTGHLFANGVVNFDNLGTPAEGRIYRGDWVWTGSEPVFVWWQPCAGPNFRAALYWGPAGSTDDRNFTQVGPSAPFLTGTGTGWFLGGSRTIVSTEAGPVLSFQVRAWEGPATTYEQAISTCCAAIAGKGPIFEVDTKDPLNAIELSPQISSAPGWRGFIFGPDGVTAVLVPEPSSIALALLGASAAGALLIVRRRK